MSTVVNCPLQRPPSTKKIHRSEISDPNLDKHAVLRGDWYANSFVNSLRAERIIQQHCSAPEGGDSPPTYTPPVYLLYCHSCSM